MLVLSLVVANKTLTDEKKIIHFSLVTGLPAADASHTCTPRNMEDGKVGKRTDRFGGAERR